MMIDEQPFTVEARSLLDVSNCKQAEIPSTCTPTRSLVKQAFHQLNSYTATQLHSELEGTAEPLQCRKASHDGWLVSFLHTFCLVSIFSNPSTTSSTPPNLYSTLHHYRLPHHIVCSLRMHKLICNKNWKKEKQVFDMMHTHFYCKRHDVHWCIKKRKGKKKERNKQRKSLEFTPFN
ncbi:hypothetical protein BC829DRAFT_61343 [Chytridium lagenaria]|nr:hypothetical protein BC829DRAFT_61343 [Chytridium lagenaria]